MRGVAWLHSFGTKTRSTRFAPLRSRSSFAMAYWGEAMSFSQPLWFFEEVDKGRAALAKLRRRQAARMAKAKTPRSGIPARG